MVKCLVYRIHFTVFKYTKVLLPEGNLLPGGPSSPMGSSEILLAPYRHGISRSLFLLISLPHPTTLSPLCNTCITKETMVTLVLLLSAVTAQKTKEGVQLII